MRDLVANYTGQLRERLRAPDQAAVDVDVPARHGEGVDFRVVDNGKFPRAVLRAGLRDERFTKATDEGVDLRVAHDRQLLVNLRRIIPPHLRFLLRRNAGAPRGGEKQCAGHCDGA